MNFKISQKSSEVAVNSLVSIENVLQYLENIQPKIVFIDKAVLGSNNLISSVLGKLELEIFILEDPERDKSFTKLQQCYEFLHENNVQRNDTVVAIGGGATTDLVGFIASTFKRGIKLCLIPTSLLSQVDACIGGKTAINFLEVKNLIGSFYNPNEIVICTEFLMSQDKQQYLTGVSEIIKHALITSEAETDYIYENIEAINQRNTKSLEEIINRSINIKKDIVNEDFLEAGKRKFLNFGHTFGHGIESANVENAILHGHAVAIGMLMALQYSYDQELLSKNDFNKSSNLLRSINYDFSKIELDPNKIYNFMKSDKKNSSNQSISLILLNGFGEPVIYEETDTNKLLNFLNTFAKDFEK